MPLRPPLLKQQLPSSSEGPTCPPPRTYHCLKDWTLPCFSGSLSALPPGLAPLLILLSAEPPGPRTGPGTGEVLSRYLLKECTGPQQHPQHSGSSWVPSKVWEKTSRPVGGVKASRASGGAEWVSRPPTLTLSPGRKKI